MKLSIIVPDKRVYKDDPAFTDRVSYMVENWAETPTAAGGPPTNVWALQWDETAGHIEFTDGTNNEIITTLPEWANQAVIAWERIHNSTTMELVLDRTAANGANNGGNILMENGDLIKIYIG
jgi:hypothetical protein|tara:strand:+ start:510 stop:875 length:366 start_codon:yes stop_codon:yes gene_type:complete